MLLDHSLEEAAALYESGLKILGARSGGSGNGTDDGRITPLGLVASGNVCAVVRLAAGQLFIKECPEQQANAVLAGEAVYAGVPSLEERRHAGASGLTKAELEEMLTLGKSLTKPVRDLVHLYEDISTGDTQNSSSTIRRGVSFFLDSDAEKDEADELSDAKSVLESISLFRRIAASAQATEREAGSGSSPSDSTSTLFAGSVGESDGFEGSSLEDVSSSQDSSAGPSTPRDVDFSAGGDEAESEQQAGDYDVSLRTPTLTPALVLPSSKNSPLRAARAGKVSVSTRLALRQMLASKAFVVTPEMVDARDRMVDYLVDTVW